MKIEKLQDCFFMYDLKGNFLKDQKFFFSENPTFKISLCKKRSFLKNLVSLARSSTVDVEGCLVWWLGPGKMGSNGYFTDNIVAVHAMRRCL